MLDEIRAVVNSVSAAVPAPALLTSRVRDGCWKVDGIGGRLNLPLVYVSPPSSNSRRLTGQDTTPDNLESSSRTYLKTYS